MSYSASFVHRAHQRPGDSHSYNRFIQGRSRGGPQVAPLTSTLPLHGPADRKALPPMANAPAALIGRLTERQRFITVTDVLRLNVRRGRRVCEAAQAAAKRGALPGGGLVSAVFSALSAVQVCHRSLNVTMVLADRCTAGVDCRGLLPSQTKSEEPHVAGIFAVLDARRTEVLPPTATALVAAVEACEPGNAPVHIPKERCDGR